MNSNIKPYPFLTALLLLAALTFPSSSAYPQTERQIGQLSKTKFLYCKFKADGNLVLQRNIRKSDSSVTETILGKRQIKNLRTKQLAIVKNSKGKNTKKKEAARLLIGNLKSCQKDRFSPMNSTAPTNDVIDESLLPPNNAEFEAEAVTIVTAPELAGTCNITAKNLDSYQAGEEGSVFFAPQSGNINCTFGADFNYPIAVVVRDAENQFVFSQKILPEQIKDRKFHSALCTEFAGCARAKKTAIALSQGPVKVQIFGYEP